MQIFSGSYNENDVNFLLKIIDIKPIENIKEKEELIQKNKKHYSEMISPEYEPSEKYLKMFYKSFEQNKERFAKDITNLAFNINKKKNPVLISLARAGTPIGVLLKRTIKELYNNDLKHYSISIIRDRGIDENALKYIHKTHPNQEFVFIDGWTGKGVINRELKFYIKKFNKKYNTNISDKLYVVSDIAGKADFTVTNEDYLIPSSALNSTISGLVSRSILNEEYIKEEDFHGCIYYKQFENIDISKWFIDEILKIIKKKYNNRSFPNLLNQNFKLQEKIDKFMNEMKKKYKIENLNYIKPGIGETTRVLLRRLPSAIILKDLNSEETNHLVILAKEKQIKLIEDKKLPYKALGIIKGV